MWSMVSSFMNDYGSLLWAGVKDTMYMVVISAIFSYVIGLPLGILLHISGKNGIQKNNTIYSVVGWIVNIGRSIPFLILMIAVIPVTRLIVGTAIGNTAPIVPLVIAASPFVARLVESSLAEIDGGVIEAAQSMGASNWQIITKVMLVESVPSLVRGAAVTVITLISYSAMAGACGGGGLGDIAIRYGFHRHQSNVMIATIIILIIIVQIIQSIFNLLAKAIDKKNK